MFSTTSHYALRLMVCVGRRACEAEPIRSQDLAEAAAVPSAYISKVMRRLELAGLVHSKKGRGGGFWLARAPGDILVSGILKAVEEPALSSEACVFGWGACRASDPCPLHKTWRALSKEVDRWADQTLESVLERA